MQTCVFCGKSDVPHLLCRACKNLMLGAWKVSRYAACCKTCLKSLPLKSRSFFQMFPKLEQREDVKISGLIMVVFYDGCPKCVPESEFDPESFRHEIFFVTFHKTQVH